MQAFLTGWIIVVRGEGRGKKFDNPLMPNKAIAIVFFFFFSFYVFYKQALWPSAFGQKFCCEAKTWNASY